jgi:hypothetical protein
LVLLVACALVSFSPLHGLSTPAAGAVDHGSAISTGAPSHIEPTHPGVLVHSGQTSSSHHDAKPRNGTTGNGTSTIHTVFTQAGTERWDSAGNDLDKSGPGPLGDVLRSEPLTDSTDASFTPYDDSVQLHFNNLEAVEAHHSASSL